MRLSEELPGTIAEAEARSGILIFSSDELPGTTASGGSEAIGPGISSRNKGVPGIRALSSLVSTMLAAPASPTAAGGAGVRSEICRMSAASSDDGVRSSAAPASDQAYESSADSMSGFDSTSAPTAGLFASTGCVAVD